MLTILREHSRRLAKDESGVVLATTVVIFLTLFVIACSVYAVGENIRLRMETQNAADAAAYTAGVVQADALSRLGAMNKAMGWTYAQEVKMDMDFIVDEWLVMSLIHWVKDFGKVAGKVLASTVCIPVAWTAAYCGESPLSNKLAIHLNNNHWKDVKTVIGAHKSANSAGKSFPKLMAKILKASINIKGMNKAEASIVKKLDKHLHTAVKTSLALNIGNTENDKRSKDKSADIKFAFLTEPKKCFEVMKNEGKFLRTVYGRNTKTKDLFKEGAGTWFVANSGNIGRHYTQLSDRLVSDWGYLGITFEPGPPVGECIPTPAVSQGHTTYKASQGYIKPFFETAICEPQWLTPDYFAKAGAIVVGVARKLHNPFQFMFNHKKPDGIYGLYSVPRGSPSDSRYIWAVAASRAGYHDHGRPKGAYNPTVDSYDNEYDQSVPPAQAPQWWRNNFGWQGLSPYNLSETDWDAVFLPLHRAWSARDPAWQNRGQAKNVGGPPVAGRWKSATGGAILADLWSSAKWEALKGKKSATGLGSSASGSGPMGMSGAINWNGMEDKVLH